MGLTPGTRLGPYELVASLGAGGMGEVYRARDPKLDRDVAIKVLPEIFVADQDRVARFQREAKTLASLSHPNIAIVHGFEQADGIHALVMELVEGEDLSQRIGRGAIPLDDALSLARQIASALEAAHEQGIVHRDLKPANIKIRPDGTVKVLDFGLAKALGPEAGAAATSMSPTITTPAMTQAGVILGTAAYMAPEQARGKAVDKRADIWAFGVVLYEMVTGRPLFKGDDVGEVLANVIKEEPKLDDVPARVRPLLERCLEKDPRRRLRDIGDMELLLPTKESSARTESPRRAFSPGWVAAGVFALMGGAAVWMSSHTRPAQQPAVRFQAPLPGAVSRAQEFTLSPDGTRIATTAAGEDRVTRLWVRTMDSLEWRPVAGTEGASNPFWSPDGRYLGFLRRDNKVMKIDAVGGDPQVLCDIVPDAGIGTGGLSWGRDGVILFSSATSVGGATVLWRVSAAGGRPSPVTALDPSDSQAGDRSPLFLPDGRHFLYLHRSRQHPGIYKGSLDQAPEKQGALALESSPRAAGGDSGNLSFTVSPDGRKGYVLFMAENTLIAQPVDPNTLKPAGEPFPVADGVARLGAGIGVFTASANGVLAYRSGTDDRLMTWFDREGKALGNLGAVQSALDLSPDGRRAIATWQNGLWLWDTGSEGKRIRFTADPPNAQNGVWSRDGERIAFTRETSTRATSLLVKPAGGGKEEVLWESPGELTANDWSPDGRYLLYSVYDPTTQWDLWALPLTGERKPRLIVQTKANEVRGQFSPDGQWIAYSSEESGTREVYVQAFSAADAAPGKTMVVSANGGDQPRWSGRGELFYRGRGGRGRGLVMMALDARGAGSSFAGTPKELFVFPAAPSPGASGNSYYDATPDGQRFLITTFAEGNLTTPLTVVLNWAGSLKQ